MNGSDVIIETQGLKKVYGMGDIEVFALAGVDIKIREGEFVAIMGPSGSGKSTLMNILGCLDRPTEGRYILDGVNVSEMSKRDLAIIRGQKLGFIFQSFNLLTRVSALENVMLPLLYVPEQKMSASDQKERAMRALKMVGLEKRCNHLPKELSGGQQQRVAIARSLINDPVLIMADEPTGNLDSRSTDEILEIFHELHDNGRTIVMVTHEPDVAEHTQRVIRIKDGKVDADIKNGHKYARVKPRIKTKAEEEIEAQLVDPDGEAETAAVVKETTAKTDIEVQAESGAEVSHADR